MTRPILFSVSTVVLLAACAGANVNPTPSGDPGLTPGGSPSPTQAPSPPPTATPAPTIGGEQIPHPTGPNDLVLQMETGGGFVPMEFFITQAPQFTLYGDGTVIFRPLEDPDVRIGGPLGGQPRFLEGRMEEDAVQALLAFALGQGRLAGARDFYGHDGIADAPTTIFELNAGGISKTVSIYALGIDDGGPDGADRQGFAALAETLSRFEDQAQAGLLGDVTLYDPSLYRVVAFEAGEGVQGQVIDWPWTDVSLDDFDAPEGAWQRVGVLPREKVALLTEMPSGGVAGLLVEDEDGKLWSIGVRPLLPDEIAAGGLPG